MKLIFILLFLTGCTCTNFIEILSGNSCLHEDYDYLNPEYQELNTPLKENSDGRT